jgi:DNA repair protein RAD16
MYIFDYEFQRVILDEAHNIRSINTLQFNAAMNLKSKYSWCLTGTLIQNS